MINNSALEENYKVTLAWGIKDPHVIPDARYTATLKVKMPYTHNRYYILAFAYLSMIHREDFLKDLDYVPYIDDVYLVNYEELS